MNTAGTTAAMGNSAIDIGDALKGGWRLFVKDIVPLLLGTLIATALSIVTLGVLAGPLYAGLYAMVVGRVRDGKQPETGDVFSCMDRFWSFFGAAIVLVLAIGMASITIIGGVLLATIWIYVFPLMVDRRMGFWDALGVSYHMVVDGGFWEHLVLIVIFALLNSIGGWAFLLTTPFTVTTIVAAYHVAQGRRVEVERA
jgi:hypothetical protein